MLVDQTKTIVLHQHAIKLTCKIHYCEYHYFVKYGFVCFYTKWYAAVLLNISGHVIYTPTATTQYSYNGYKTAMAYHSQWPTGTL